MLGGVRPSCGGGAEPRAAGGRRGGGDSGVAKSDGLQGQGVVYAEAGQKVWRGKLPWYKAVRGGRAAEPERIESVNQTKS